MATWWITNNPEERGNQYFKSLIEGKRTIESVVKDLDEFVKGYKKSKKQHDYWINFKPFDNPKNFPERFANGIHKLEVENPEDRHTYADDMNIQKNQFNITKNALIKYLNTLNDEKLVRKTMKKIEIRSNKID